MKLAKTPQLQLGAPTSAKEGKAAQGFAALLDTLSKPKVAKAAKADRPEKSDRPATSDKKAPPQADPLATQLAQLQALAPQAPLRAVHARKHDQPVAVAAPLKHAPAERPAPLEPPAPSKQSSAQPAALFTLTDAPRETPKASAPPPPAWAPKELVADDTARLTVFPNAANLTAEGHALHLQVRDGEVSLRVRGELAAQLKSSEAELRVALAQEGLKLRESTFTPQEHDGERRRHQHEERQDEWT